MGLLSSATLTKAKEATFPDYSLEHLFVVAHKNSFHSKEIFIPVHQRKDEDTSNLASASVDARLYDHSVLQQQHCCTCST